MCGLVALHVVPTVACFALASVWWQLGILGVLGVVQSAMWAAALARLKPPEPFGLWLRRAQQPELFEVVDDIAAQMGMKSLDEVELIAEANAFATQRDGRDVVALGMPLLAVNLRWELVATIAHELGHVRGGDVTHPARFAWAAIAALGACPAHVLAPLARHLADDLFLERLTIGRAHEKRADGWSAHIVGKGGVGPSLRIDAGIGFVWDNLMRDLAVLAQNGFFVDNAFALLRRAYEHAQASGHLRSIHAWIDDALIEDDEHPNLRDRHDHADHMVRRLPHKVPKTDETARMLLRDAETLERGWTRALPMALHEIPIERLRIIEDATACARAHSLRAVAARRAIEERAGAGAADLPTVSLLQMIHDGITGQNVDRTWLVPVRVGSIEHHLTLRHISCTPAEAAAWITALLYERIVAGTLKGEVALGVPSKVDVGDRSLCVEELAKQLAGSGGPWLSVMSALKDAGRSPTMPARPTPAERERARKPRRGPRSQFWRRRARR